MIYFLMIISTINLSGIANSKSSNWKLGGYQKGFEIHLSTGVILKQHAELPPNLPIGYLVRIKTSAFGALLIKDQNGNLDKIWLGPRTEVSTLGQENPNSIHLAGGQIRARGNFAIRTLIGECQLTSEQDVVIDWKESDLELRLLVLGGEIHIPCFDFDKPLTLKKGESAVFYADKSAGAPVFDVLPSGRKMPRGIISQSPEAIKAFSFNWEALQKEIEMQATPPPPKKKKVIIRNCREPSADTGQCAIKKSEKGVCTLYRCSAQGTWEYGIDLRLGHTCDSDGRIASCGIN